MLLFIFRDFTKELFLIEVKKREEVAHFLTDIFKWFPVDPVILGS